MSSYNVFAKYYDVLSKDVDYEVRSDYISGFFNQGSKKLLDVACGTGEFTRCFYERGFDVTGVDISEEMLEIASTKCGAEFIKADMRNLNFNNSFDCAVCTFDAVNHLTDKNDVRACFESVYNSIKDGGVFVFDMNTVYKHKNILAENTFIFEDDDYYIVWDNEEYGDNTVKILLDFFIFNGKSYDRYSESFFEKAYTVDEIKELLYDYFDVIGIYDRENTQPQEDSQRLYFVCKRK